MKPQPDEAREWAKRLHARAGDHRGGHPHDAVAVYLLRRDWEAIVGVLESQAERIETLERLAREAHGALDDLAWLSAEWVEWRGCDHDVGCCSCVDRGRVERACGVLAALTAAGVKEG
jgi:hypothetical protein